jgi:hypothetical protein
MRTHLLLALVGLATGFVVPVFAQGKDTEAVVTAANAFLATLSASQFAAVKYDYTLANAEGWSNVPTAGPEGATRNGLKFGSLNTTQLTAALALTRTALSATGYTLLQEIRAADDVIATESPIRTVADLYGFGSGNYYIAFVGTPSTVSAWMLQIGGHHLAYNLTFSGKYVSGTPMFAGVEPRTWTASGTTHAPLETQRAAIYNLAQVLGTLPAAKLSKIFDDMLMGPNGVPGRHDTDYPQSYPAGISGRGVLASSLAATQQGLVKTAIEAWVNTVHSTIASDLLSAYESDSALAQTYVAYSGSMTLDTQGSYVRIDGPRVWIEFVCQPGVAYPNNIHYHSIWRDKTADYGGMFK